MFFIMLKKKRETMWKLRQNGAPEEKTNAVITSDICIDSDRVSIP